MPQTLANITIVVRDYDEAIAFFTDALGFRLVEDTAMSGGKRWVVVAPAGGGTGLLLARAATPEQEAAIGNQTGGRVAFFLHTDDFARDYDRMRARGVTFVEQPRHQVYGTVVVFQDLYGNKWDLVQPRSRAAGWDTQFKAMAEAGDDSLLDADALSATDWDETEWQW